MEQYFLKEVRKTDIYSSKMADSRKIRKFANDWLVMIQNCFGIHSICDPSARNESHVGSIQVEKIGNMHDVG